MTDPTPTRDEAVPTGWKLVPEQLTPEMWDAMAAAYSSPACWWRAALASAPAPASGRVDAVAIDPSRLETVVIEGFEPLLRLEEIANRDTAKSVSVRTDDLKALISFATNAAAMSLHMGETMRASLSPVAGGDHGPFGYLVIVPGLNEEHWRLSSESDNDTGHVSLPMFTKVDPFTLASLSPAATPVSEAEPVAWRVRERAGFPWRLLDGDPERMPAARGLERQALYLATPAPSPAGGDVDGATQIALGLFKTTTERAQRITKLEDALRKIAALTTDSLARDRATAALSQSTSGGRVGE